MTQDEPEMTFEESVKEVMQTLPPVIRDYLAQGKYSLVSKQLMTKYRLRVDQSGVLEREIMLLLMGVEDANEFMATLESEAAIADDVVRMIMTDINQEIFMPLREQMRNEGKTVNAAPQRPPIVNAPVPNYASPAPLPPRFLTSGATIKFGESRSVLVQPTPVTAPEVPVNLPGTIPSVPAPMPAQAPSTPPPPTLPLTPAPVRPPFSSDPYREPLAE